MWWMLAGGLVFGLVVGVLWGRESMGWRLDEAIRRAYELEDELALEETNVHYYGGLYQQKEHACDEWRKKAEACNARCEKQAATIGDLQEQVTLAEQKLEDVKHGAGERADSQRERIVFLQDVLSSVTASRDELAVLLRAKDDEVKSLQGLVDSAQADARAAWEFTEVQGTQLRTLRDGNNSQAALLTQTQAKLEMANKEVVRMEEELRSAYRHVTALNATIGAMEEDEDAVLDVVKTYFERDVEDE